MEIGQKLRRLRKLRGLTIEEVADRADLTKGSISQLERDLASPSIITLKQVLDVLGVSLSSFFSGISEQEKNIYKIKDRILQEKTEEFRIENLIPKLKYLEMDAQLLTIFPNGQIQTEFNEDEGFGFVIKGKVDLTINTENRIINKGDCFYIFYENELTIKNVGIKEAEILLVNY